MTKFQPSDSISLHSPKGATSKPRGANVGYLQAWIRWARVGHWCSLRFGFYSTPVFGRSLSMVAGFLAVHQMSCARLWANGNFGVSAVLGTSPRDTVKMVTCFQELVSEVIRATFAPNAKANLPNRIGLTSGFFGVSFPSYQVRGTCLKGSHKLHTRTTGMIFSG